MKNILFVIAIFFISTGLFAQSSGSTHVSSSELCISIEKIASGFENSFTGLFTTEDVEISLDIFKNTIYKYKPMYLVNGFNAGYYKKHVFSTSVKWSVFFEIESSQEEIRRIWGELETCLESWDIIESDSDYGYFGFIAYNIFEKNGISLSFEASTGDDNYITLEFEKL